MRKVEFSPPGKILEAIILKFQVKNEDTSLVDLISQQMVSSQSNTCSTPTLGIVCMSVSLERNVRYCIACITQHG